MTRRAFPYTPFDTNVQEPQTNDLGTVRRKLPMDAPDLLFRNHYNTPSETRRGELGNTLGNLAQVVPIHAAGDSPVTEGVRGASFRMEGGTVKGYMKQGTIRKAILVSRNLFSPTSHPSDVVRAAASAKVPPPAVQPSKDIGMPAKMGKRGTGGNFTIPAPMVAPSWPTSTQWLHQRILGGM